MKGLTIYLLESEGKVKNEKEFRSWAEKKFKSVFKDELDKDKMNDTIDGFLKTHKKEADEGKWGELVGTLNQSFSK